eukprot:GEMP01072812.1.p1 GENE.GEMP01072812.1~~GEMP01072812.1.p1  ORF type:complete len:109 (-),score=0.12 GEMP01072812.1:763-1089(-)
MHIEKNTTDTTSACYSTFLLFNKKNIISSADTHTEFSVHRVTINQCQIGCVVIRNKKKRIYYYGFNKDNGTVRLYSMHFGIQKNAQYKKKSNKQMSYLRVESQKKNAR